MVEETTTASPNILSYIIAKFFFFVNGKFGNFCF